MAIEFASGFDDWWRRRVSTHLTPDQTAGRQESPVGLLLRDVEAYATDWLWECDKHGRLTRVPARMADQLGRPAAQLRHQPLCALVASASLAEALAQRLDSRIAFRDQVVSVQGPDQIRWWSLSARPIFGSDGALTGWRGVGADITDATRTEAQLQDLAQRDSLTGLTNRHRFHALVNEELLAANQGFALLLINLDNFKSINDLLGHATGDALLRSLACRFSDRIVSPNHLARLGSDEFGILAPGIVTSEAAQALGQTLLEATQQPCIIGYARIEVRASIGIVLAPGHGGTTDALLANVDAALHAAKEVGGDRLHLFDRALGERRQERRILVRDLGEALQQNQFHMVYQPQYDSVLQRVTAFEALLRWCHPERGLIGPNQFIPLAESSGQIVPIGAWVLEQACRDALDWDPEIKIAVNLSAVQLNSRSVLDMISAALQRSGLPAERLELEVTESALVRDNAAARATLGSLRDFGIRIALDDFGVGYSMLSYLRNFPFDKLKIDHSFVAALADNQSSSDRGIFRAIMDLAAALNLRTVAEGVDSQIKLDAVLAHGCAVVQGYLIAKPMPAIEVPDFLASQSAF